MWTLVVVLMLSNAEITFARYSMPFASASDCAYALGFVVDRRLGDWEVSYAACEPTTYV